jgi:hypothetical protein
MNSFISVLAPETPGWVQLFRTMEKAVREFFPQDTKVSHHTLDTLTSENARRVIITLDSVILPGENDVCSDMARILWIILSIVPRATVIVYPMSQNNVTVVCDWNESVRFECDSFPTALHLALWNRNN